MGLRYRKRIRICPGITLNISKSGISTTIGPKGASVNFGKNGTYLNTGIPGTGLYSREKISSPSAKVGDTSYYKASDGHGYDEANISDKSPIYVDEINKNRLLYWIPILLSILYAFLLVILVAVIIENMTPLAFSIIDYTSIGIVFFIVFFLIMHCAIKKNITVRKKTSIASEQHNIADPLNDSSYNTSHTNMEASIVLEEKDIQLLLNGCDSFETDSRGHHNLLHSVNPMFYNVDNVLDVQNFYSFDIKKLYDIPLEKKDDGENVPLLNKIRRCLAYFGIEVNSLECTVGPRFTLIEVTLSEGQKVAPILGIENDMSLNIGYDVSRIFPIFKKGRIGIEIANKTFHPIGIGNVLASFSENSFNLPCAIGINNINELFCFDLKSLPHLLVAGSTGQGKTNVLHAIILSLVSFSKPTDLKLILFDSKGLEFGFYTKIGLQFLADIPGVSQIVDNEKEATRALESITFEIKLRQSLLKKAGLTNITEYNQFFLDRKLSPSDGFKYLPFLVLVIDDYEEFKWYDGSVIENNLLGITMNGLSVGIHVVLSTKRPSYDIISTGIKSNFSTRISLHLPEISDSYVVLDRDGAEKLNNNGDMLFLKNNNLQRAQCALVETSDIIKITERISSEVAYLYSLP